MNKERPKGDRDKAEIITLRAIALKQSPRLGQLAEVQAEIITLRAIALKLLSSVSAAKAEFCRDHNATSYSTETLWCGE